jgi:predicted transcriptional regulator
MRIYFDGFEGWTRRALERAKAMDEGRPFPPSRGLAFESMEELVLLLTPTRLDLLGTLKDRAVSIGELADILGRDVSALHRDLSALKRGIFSSVQVANPENGQVRAVSAPADVSISLEG